MTFPIYQGERTISTENLQLGEFMISNLPPAPRADMRVTVFFQIDANGILKVFAEEKKSGQNNQVIITKDKHNLSKKEIERMLEDATRYKLEDQVYKKKVLAKNKLEDLLYKLRRDPRC